MNEEIKAILKMIEEGKISAAEGEKLITSLNDKPKFNQQLSVNNTKKFLKIEVYSLDKEDDEGETKVKVNVPLGLAKSFLQMNSIRNQISVNANNVDLDFDEIIGLIENNAEGELINVESESNRIRIWIE